MQSIITRYLGATNTKPSRVFAKASAGAHKLTVNWDHSLCYEQNHTAAAKALAEKAGWNGHYQGGSLNASSYCFVIECETRRGRFDIVNGKAVK